MPNAKEYMPCDFIYRKFQNRQNQSEMTESLSVVAWGQAVRGDGTLYVIKNITFFNLSDGYTSMCMVKFIEL